MSALPEDLHERGRLDSTLVAAIREFGRTSRVGQIPVTPTRALVD